MTRVLYIKILILLIVYANGHIDRKSSLTFVIDVTDSMEPVISKVELASRDIFDAVMKSSESPIESVVLVTFADTEYGATNVVNVTNIKNRDVFEKSLKLALMAGGDCPEQSISGIQTGIENSAPGSTIYVFTDASAKDFDKYNFVREAAQSKEIQIIFVLTGTCEEYIPEGHDVYVKLALDTSGQVFNLRNESIADIIKIIETTMASRRITLVAKSFPPGTHTLNYSTDGSTSDTLVILSGSDPMIKIKDDGGKLDIKNLATLKNVLALKVNETMPGTHTLSIDSSTDCRVLVSAKSSIQFQHGFSPFVPSSLNDTTVQPGQDKSHLAIKVTGNFLPQTVQLLDSDDNILPYYTFPLKPLDGAEKLFLMEPVEFPVCTFRIVVLGLDKDNNVTITRIGSTLLETQNPYIVVNDSIPIIAINGAPTITVDLNTPLQLKCSVKAYPAPKITWEQNGTILESETFLMITPNQFASIHKIKQVQNSTTYVCKATNAEGEALQSVVVQETPKPFYKVLDTPKDTTIQYNKTGFFKCKADAYPPAKITWLKNNKTLETEDNIKISDDGSIMTIQEMQPVNRGSYACEVKYQLKMEIFPFVVNLSGCAKPKVNMASKLFLITENHDAKIYCRIEEGIPKPKLEWYYKNSTSNTFVNLIDLTKDDEHLSLTYVNRNQTGTYQCVATNELGNDTMESELVVEYPPTVGNVSGPMAVEAGEEVALTCYADGMPEPDVKWIKDDKPLTALKFTSSGDHRLIFKADLVDKGIYKCDATNKLGSDDKTISVEVQTPPKVSIKESDPIDVEYNESINIHCQVLGYPEPDIIWTNLNTKQELISVFQEISPFNFTSLLIIDNVINDATYECKAKNKLGASEHNVTVKSFRKPFLSVTEHPKNETHYVKYMDSAKFSCKADAYPPAEINWYKNGIILVKDDLSVSSDGSVLTIKNMKPRDEGKFMCEAKNKHYHFKFPFNIQISGLTKPKLNMTSKLVHATENHEAKINCRIEEGIPKPTIEWYYKNTTSNTFVNLIDAKDEEYLSLTHVSRNQTGTYQCVATNEVGNDTMKSELVVEYPPTISNVSGPLAVDAGEEVALTCYVDSKPESDLIWTKDDKPLTASKFTSSGDRRLIFKADLADKGIYKCDATNKLGSDNKTISIEVQKSPKVSIKESDPIDVEYNESINIHCEVLGYPKPDIVWTNLNTKQELTSVFQEISPFNFTSLLIIDNVINDATYECKARNKLGASEHNVTVKSFRKPFLSVTEHPKNETHYVKYMDSAKFSCTADAYPPAEINWYKNGIILVEDDLSVTTEGSVLTIKNMQPRDEGKFMCEAKNKHYHFKFPFNIEITGLTKPKLNMTSKLVHATENHEAKIHCRIEEGIPKPTIKWYYKNTTSNTFVNLIDAKDEECLSLTHVSRNQTGTYQCVATNEVGNDTMKSELFVEYPPTISNVSGPLAVDAGEEVALTCYVDSKPESDLIWTKDDKLLTASKFISSGDRRLIFKADLADKGIYKCDATNKLGSDNKTISVEVQKSPKVSIKESDPIDVEYNESINIHCEVLGYPKPDIVWTNLNTKQELTSVLQELSPFNFTSLLIIDNVINDATYECKARNKLGASEHNVTVKNLQKPFFTVSEHPKNETHYVKYMDSAKFFCKADAYPPAEINWYKNGIILVKDDLSVSSDGSVLTIKNMQPRDEGKFMCKAINKRKHFNFPFNIRIPVIPEIYKTVVKSDTTEYIKEGTDLELVCKIVKGIPKPTITWHVLVENKKYIQINNTNNLETITIRNVKRNDSLAFACQAKNIAGSDILKMTLQVGYPPAIAEDNNTYTVKAGQNIEVPCVVDGRPEPTVNWYKYATEGKYMKTDENSLKLSPKLRDKGTYRCTATNMYGTSVKNVQINVYTLQIIPSHKVNKVTEGDTLKLKCLVRGIPKPKIKWFYEGTKENPREPPIFLAENSLLEIEDMQYDRRGLYSCVASNNMGGQESYTYEVVVHTPVIINNKNTIIRAVDGDRALQIHCDATGFPKPDIKWTINGVDFPKGGADTITINNINKSVDRSYLCEASNIVDSDYITFTLIVDDYPCINNITTTTIRAKTETYMAMDCPISHKSEDQLRWYKDNKKIVDGCLQIYSIKTTDAGLYTCRVSNSTTSVSANVLLKVDNVRHKDCLLKINPNAKNKPLILTQHYTWPDFKFDNGYLYMPQNHSILLACSKKSKLNLFNYEYVSAYCNPKGYLKILGRIYDYSDLHCTEEVKLLERRTKKPCLGDDSELVKIVFEAFDKNIEVYEVCLDTSYDVPLYAKHSMHLPLAESVPNAVTWIDDKLKKNFDKFYGTDEQIKTITCLRRHRKDRCVFSKKQLVSSLDVFPGVPQRGPFSYFNIIPQWSTCHNKNWDDVESRVRTLAKTSNSKLVVWTGTAEALKMPNAYGETEYIYISDQSDPRKPNQPVSTYIWKVVQNSETQSSLAIIQLNVPDITLKQAKRYVKCRDVCQTTTWMKGPNWHDTTKGYVFCCHLINFEKAFGYTGFGIFGHNMYNIL